MSNFKIILQTEKTMSSYDIHTTLHQIILEALQRYPGLSKAKAVVYYETLLYKIAAFASNKYALRAIDKINLVQLLKIKQYSQN